MYHIKKDLRSVKSAELLYRGLIYCMEKKEFDKISISDISLESSVSRATYYRNFDNIIDILHWKCDQQFNKVLTDFVSKTPQIDAKAQLVEHIFYYWLKNIEIIEVLLKIGRVDIIFVCFVENADILANYLNKQVEMQNFPYDYFISIRAGIFVGTLKTWIDKGKKESVSEIINIIEKQWHFSEKSSLIF